jgi:hypothetical protein
MALTNPNVTASYVPLTIGDLYIRYTIRAKTKTALQERMRPSLKWKRPYPELSLLAHGVLAQAGRDAIPDHNRCGVPFTDSSRRRILQCEALLWLCSDDPDLLWWAMLADYPIRRLHHTFRPLLHKFCLEHRDIALKFLLPDYAMAWCLPPKRHTPEISTAQNRADQTCVPA